MEIKTPTPAQAQRHVQRCIDGANLVGWTVTVEERCGSYTVVMQLEGRYVVEYVHMNLYQTVQYGVDQLHDAAQRHIRVEKAPEIAGGEWWE